MVDERDNDTPARRTFLVWSWLGLLGAYLYTTMSLGTGLLLSAGFARNIASLANQGRAPGSHFTPVTVLCVIAPIVVLSLAYVRFFTYSVALYRVLVVDPPREAEGGELLSHFRPALAYLIATWIVVVALRALPVVLNLPFLG
jgi:hypothetical protein